MTATPYNFCKPGRLASDREQRLAGWLRGACALAAKTWSRRLPFAAEWLFKGFDTFQPADGLAKIGETIVGYRLELAASKVATLLALPRALVLAVVGGMVGDSGTALPADRELTLVEESLFEFFVNRHLLPPMHETWPGLEPLRLELRPTDANPRWNRMFPPDEPVVLCTFSLRGSFGEHDWHWLLPREGLLPLLDEPDQGHAGGNPADVRPRLETLVKELPVEVTVHLGTVELRLSQLSSLAVGDVVILNQRVSETLTAVIGEEKKFRGWPGRAGASQVFRIESLVNR